MPWSGLQSTTIDDYVHKEITSTVMRKKLFLRALQDRGRITYDGEGKNYTWPVRYKRTGLTPVADGDTNTFSQVDKRKLPTMPYRGYTAAQSLNKFNKVANKGEAALVKIWANIVDELIDDIRYFFNQKLIQIDGNAAGFTKEIHGLDSLFNKGSGSSNNKTYLSNGTYAGLAQTLGNYGGGITPSSSVWPEGSIDPQYDFWTPLILTATGTGWASSTHTFAANSIEIVRYMIVNTERNGETVDAVFLAKDYYQSHLLNLDSKERSTITKGTAPKGESGFGWVTVNQDGTDIIWDTDVAPSTGYGINFDELELKSWQDQLFMSTLDNDIETNSDRVLLDFYGNLICESPRCQSKVLN